MATFHRPVKLGCDCGLLEKIRSHWRSAYGCGLKDISAWHEKSLVIVSLSIVKIRLWFSQTKPEDGVQTRDLFRMYLPNDEDTWTYLYIVPFHLFSFYRYVHKLGGGQIFKSMHINKAVLWCLVC